MTIVKKSRNRLDPRLRDRAATVLLLSDEDGDVTERIHDVAEMITKAGQFVFLLRDLTILTPTETQQWFEAGGHYVVLGGRHRVVAVRGTLEEFLLSDGTISRIEIRAALARGDLL